MSCRIVIPAYNKCRETAELCKRAVDSVLLHVKYSPLELVIIDNNSHVMPDWYGSDSPLEVILLNKNIGFGPAVNQGFEGSISEYVCQMNSDCELVEDSISILIDVMNRYHLDVAMPEHFENCQYYGIGKSNSLMDNDWRFGAFWVARRSAFEAVGGFDPRFEMCYFEDFDLWKRMESRGFKISGYRGTWVKHVGQASALDDYESYYEKNKRLYESLHGGR